MAISLSSFSSHGVSKARYSARFGCKASLLYIGVE
jgi:hypothetical protein